MVQDPADPEVVVIGAGAAGIGAGLALASARVPFVILEAKDRIGGRAYTDTDSLGHLWDHGCHWFHSADRNVLRHLAERLGHSYREAPRAPLVNRYIGGKWINNPFEGDYVWELLAAIPEAARNGEDLPASVVLDEQHPWYPLIHHWITLMYSVEPSQVSTLDAARYEDTHINLPVRDGYGALIARLGAGLPIRTEVATRAVIAERERVRVETDAGTLTAKAAIIAVPARAIQMRSLTIRPEIGADLVQAYEDVPMGWYEKVGIAFDGNIFGEREIPYADIFDPVSPATRPLNFEIHPFGRPIAIAHMAGDLARDMAGAGEETMISFAVDTLVTAYGGDIRRKVVRSAVTRWSADPYINGGYSCARPGRADARKRFSDPIHDRVFLAGEYVHRSAMATAHGAYETGIAAATRAIRAAGLDAPEPDPLWIPGPR
jgi:monoamine oxidase